MEDVTPKLMTKAAFDKKLKDKEYMKSIRGMTV